MLKVKFMGQLLSPTGTLDAQKAPPHAMLHDLSDSSLGWKSQAGSKRFWSNWEVSVFLERTVGARNCPATAHAGRQPGQAGTKGVGNSTEVSCPPAQDSQVCGPKQGAGSGGQGQRGRLCFLNPQNILALALPLQLWTHAPAHHCDRGLNLCRCREGRSSLDLGVGEGLAPKVPLSIFSSAHSTGKPEGFFSTPIKT